MDFLGDASSNASAVDVIAFVREVVEKFPDLRSSIVGRLLESFAEIKSGKVFRGAMWIVGEYAASGEEIRAAMKVVRKVIGEVPILASEQVRLVPLSLRLSPFLELTVDTTSTYSASSTKPNKKRPPPSRTTPTATPPSFPSPCQ
jgi:coatomer subunit beta